MNTKNQIEVSLIDRAYTVRKPNGEITSINRFDYNLAVAAGDLDGYLQCHDTSWLRVRSITILNS